MKNKPRVRLDIRPCHSLKDLEELIPDDWKDKSEQEIRDEIYEIIETELLWDLFTLEVELRRGCNETI
jgi:hypothetical protein